MIRSESKNISDVAFLVDTNKVNPDEKLVFTNKPEELWERCVNLAISNKTAEITAKIFKS